MIRYKVVDDNRDSITITSSKYKLHYEKGDTVKAIPGTLGVFVFRDFDTAANFSLEFENSRGCQIVKVEAKGKGKHPNRISSFSHNEGMDRFYSRMSLCQNEVMGSPPGTLCYPEIEVLE